MPVQLTSRTLLRRVENNRCACMNVGPQNPMQVVRHAGVAMCLRFIASDFCRPIRVTDLEKVSGLSRRGLQKAFLKHTGYGPGQILRQHRIQRAKQILEEDDMPMQQVAAMCGYRRVNSLWIAFRKAVGISPKRYQRQVELAAQLRKPAIR